MKMGTELMAAKATKKLSWPKSLTDQIQLIRQQLATNQQPVDASELAKAFTRADSTRIAEMLNALASRGMACHVSDGKYISA
ncbi:MAG: class SAM-dependent methyltransferase [Schlesneria sp.]|nr:class SAM-dependent methyltransferase [Schlesneria sp.]